MAVKARRWTVKLAGILFGGMGLMLALLLFMMLMVPGTNPSQAKTGALVVATYGGLAAAFLALGTGLFRLRRWARNLALQMTWPWLITGFFLELYALIWMPGAIQGAFQSQGPADLVPASAILAIQIAFAVIFIALPAGLLGLLFNVAAKAACESAQAEADWTDKTSPLALSLSLVLGLWALFMFPGLWAQNFYVPFFGRALSGAQGALAALCLAGLSAWCSLGAYQRKAWSWKLAIFVYPVWGLSSLLTFHAIGWQGVMQVSNPEMPAPQLAQTLAIVNLLPMEWMLNGMSVLWVAYIIWIRKDFKKD